MVFVAQTPVIPGPIDVSVIGDNFDLSTIGTTDLIFAGASLVGAILLAQVAKRSIRRVLRDFEGLPVMTGDVIAGVVQYSILVLGLVLALEALGFSLGLVGSVILLLIVVVVLSARPLLQDLGAGLIIQMRQPFGIGDQVDLGNAVGRVDEVNARTVRVITVDGKRVHLPNRTVLEGAIVNVTVEGARMTTFIAGVDYATDLDRARDVIVAAMSGTPGVLDAPPPEAFVDEFASSTINIACRFWHAPEIQAEWASRDAAMRAVKRALDTHGITIAFPQRVLWTGDAA